MRVLWPKQGKNGDAMALFASRDVRAAFGAVGDGDADDDVDNFFDPDGTYGAAVAQDPRAGPGATPIAPRAAAAKKRFAPKAASGSAVFRGGGADDDSDEDATDDLEAANLDAVGRIETLEDALAFVRQAVQRQIERAKELHAAPNTAIPGDGVARGVMLLLLPEPMLRLLFLEIVRAPAAWPRVRALFGAPPYHFLLPEDGGTLRAAGFARGRENIAYDEANRIANVAQFVAQFQDPFEREYRLVLRRAVERDPVPSAQRVYEQLEATFHMQVKIRKRSLKQKRLLAHGDTKKRLFFPRVGERIELRETRTLQRVLRLRTPQTLQVQVLAVRPRGLRAHTAELVVRKQ